MEIWITKMSQYMSGKDVIEVDYKVMNTSKQRWIKVVMGLYATFSVPPNVLPVLRRQHHNILTEQQLNTKFSLT